ncbi:MULTISPECIES: hypothetical protein [Bacteria]|uniref:portal protein n=1 Tax=Bacteria TaxID=2 RepID=UPI000A5C1F8D|nr:MULTISPECIES: hypothetical protein [Bacteria]
MENKLNIEELIERFKKFERQSYNHYKDLFEQIKKDRQFIAGNQTDDLDHTLTDVSIGEGVPLMTLNVVKNIIRSIVNSYTPNTYKWQYTNNQGVDVNLNTIADQFLSDADNSTATVEALSNAVGTALGVLVFSNDYDIDGSIKPVLYSIPDVTNVRLDPNASKLNFADATKAAIVEIKSKEWFKANYGIDYLNEYYKPLIDISEDYDRKTMMPLVTYYEKENNQVTCYKLAGSELLEEPQILPYSYIPVVPVLGESSWISASKQSWTGITTIMRPIQRIINYAYRQIIIRASKVPKNIWIGGDEALQGREKYWQNSERNLNPIRIYNEYSKDHTRKLDPPHREDNQIVFEDVTALMDKSLQMTNSIVGIPAIGLESEIEKTATEVLTNQKTFNNNVRNYIYHLKYSMQLIGLLFAEEIYKQPLFGKIKVSVVAGPDDAMDKQEARVQLSSYASLITDENDKKALLKAQCMIEEDNKYINNFAKMLTPQQNTMNLQAQELLSQANNEIKNRDAQILELQKQVNDLQMQQQLQAYSTEQQILLNNQKFEHEKEMKLLDAQIAAGNPSEMAKTQAEIDKAQMSVEKEAISLRKEQIKAMNQGVI